MSATYLDSILEYHRARAETDSRAWRSRANVSSTRASLRSAILDHRHLGLAVIAEIKRRSPSKGWLAEGLDAAATAVAYVAGGATAISVLTDGPHFGGSLDDLIAVAGAVDVPVLRKDFTVSPNDVVDAAECGASAVLLIVAALTPHELAELLATAREVNIDALVEVHSAEEARRALDLGADLIGVNQRDLHTFAVDATRAEFVASALPTRVVTVAESGFTDPGAAERAAAAGFDAVLIGERLVVSNDKGAAVASFVGFPIGARQS
jgi:indole-3-glycerol phosphate synthase